MEHLERPLRAGDPLDWWWLTPVEAALFKAPPEPMPPATRSRFVNAFVGVGDLPCRRLFRRTMAEREVTLPTRLDWVEHALGIAAPRLEFSSFWHRPTHVRRFARTTLTVDRPGLHPLAVETCGGLWLWVDRVAAGRFTPFSRNRPQTAELALRLEEGRHELILLTEELCERDTTWVAGLTWRSEAAARLGVLAPGGAAALDQLRRQAAGLRLDREAYADEPLRLLLPEPAEHELTLRLEGAGHGNAEPPVRPRLARVPHGGRIADLGRAGDVPAGYRELSVTLELAGMRVRRRLAAGFHGAAALPAPAAGPDERRRQALEWLAEHGDPQIGTAIAIAATGGDPARVLALLEDALRRIEDREDCCDFWLVPLLLVWQRMPAVLERIGLRERAATVILGFRYWMDEPGNDVMWFWSENHALCFHAAQYLAGLAFPEELFGNSGRTGAAQRALGRQRLEQWFAEIEAGGFVEWHSPAYYPIDCIGLLALHELAPDAPIRDAAKRCLDRLFTLTALSTLGGIPGASQGRTYDRDLKFPALTETAALAWIEWGVGALNPMAYAAPLLCLGVYRAPPAAARLARWDEPCGVEARYSQGPGGAAALVSWKGRDALLGSVVGYHPGEPGYQAVVAQLSLAGHADARIWISHPGQDDPFGSRRPSYWAGDGIMPHAAQWRSLALLLYRLDQPEAIPWTHAYARRTAFDEFRIEGGWLFVRSGRGLGAVLAVNGLEPVEAGPCAGYELRSPGRANGWLLRAGSLDHFGSLAGFARALLAARLEAMPGEALAFADPEHGPVSLDWSGRLLVAGREQGGGPPAVVPELLLDDGRRLEEAG